MTSTAVREPRSSDMDDDDDDITSPSRQ